MSPWIIYFLSSAEFVSSELKLFSFWFFEPLTVSNCSNIVLRVPCSDDSCRKSYHFMLYQANPFHLLDSIQCIFVPRVVYLESIWTSYYKGKKGGEPYIWLLPEIKCLFLTFNLKVFFWIMLGLASTAWSCHKHCKGEVDAIVSVISARCLNKEFVLCAGTTNMGFLSFRGVARRSCYKPLPRILMLFFFFITRQIKPCNAPFVFR